MGVILDLRPAGTELEYPEAARDAAFAAAWRERKPIPLEPFADSLLPAPGGAGHRFILQLSSLVPHLTALEARLYWGDATALHGHFTPGLAFYRRHWIVLQPWLFRSWSEGWILGVLAHEIGHCYVGPDEDEATAWIRENLPDVWRLYEPVRAAAIKKAKAAKQETKP